MILAIEITGLDDLRENIARLQNELPIVLETAVKECIELLVVNTMQSLQDIVYDRDSGPYAGQDRGEFADAFKYDIETAFGNNIPEIKMIGNIVLGKLWNDSLPGLWMEFGTEDHPVDAVNVDQMEWRNAYSGNWFFSEHEDISGIEPTEWMQTAWVNSQADLEAIFMRRFKELFDSINVI